MYLLPTIEERQRVGAEWSSARGLDPDVPPPGHDWTHAAAGLSVTAEGVALAVDEYLDIGVFPSLKTFRRFAKGAAWNTDAFGEREIRAGWRLLRNHWRYTP